MKREPVRLEAAAADELEKTTLESHRQSAAGEFLGDLVRTLHHGVSRPETTYRMFRLRDFDFVMVAANLPDEKPGVMKVLEKQHASSRNLQFASDDTYAMQAAFDPKWDSASLHDADRAGRQGAVSRSRAKLDILELRR